MAVPPPDRSRDRRIEDPTNLLDHPPGRAAPAAVVRHLRDIGQWCLLGRSGAGGACRICLCELGPSGPSRSRLAPFGWLADRRWARRHDRARDRDGQPARPGARWFVRSRRLYPDLRYAGAVDRHGARAGRWRSAPARRTRCSPTCTRASARVSIAVAGACLRWFAGASRNPLVRLTIISRRPRPLRSAASTGGAHVERLRRPCPRLRRAAAAPPMRLMRLLSANMRVYAIFVACVPAILAVLVVRAGALSP